MRTADSEFLLNATIYHGNHADTNTLVESVSHANATLKQIGAVWEIREVVADKGYHSNESLVECQKLGPLRTRTYIPEPDLDVTHKSFVCHSLIPTVDWKETRCWFTNYGIVHLAHLRSGVRIQEDGLVRAALP